MATGATGICGTAALVSGNGAGIAPSAAPCGAADGDKGGAGGFGIVCTPAALGIAGTRGKENISPIGGNTAAADGEDAPFSPCKKPGVAPVTGDPVAGTFPGDAKTPLKSAPAGGAVGGEVGIPEMPGNENISFPGGSVGATAIGEIFPSVRKSAGTPAAGNAGAVPGAPGANAVAPANDAAMARKSVSVSGPGWIDDDGEDAGLPGFAFTADVSCSGNSPVNMFSVNMVVGISSASTSSEGGDAAPPLPFPRSFGITRKNSFASFSSNAGSGSGIEAKG